MNKKALIIGAAVLLALTTVASWWLSPRLEAALTEAAMKALSNPEFAGAFKELKVSFSGREATLEGKVASELDHDLAGKIIAERVRLSGVAGGINFVSAVINHTTVDVEFARVHPKPWLMAILANGSVTIAGVLSSDQERANAAQALSTRLAPPPTPLVNKLTSPAGARAAVNLEGTLKDIPDLAAAALQDKAHAVIAWSLCDGSWSVEPAETTTDDDLVKALQPAQAAAEPIKAATASLRQWQSAEKEKQMIASLPEPVVTAVIAGAELHVFGTIGDEDSKRRLLVALGSSYPKSQLMDHLKVATSVKPNANFAAAVGTIAAGDSETDLVAVLKPSGKASTWIDKGSMDELTTMLASAGLDAAVGQSVLDALKAAKSKAVTKP